MTRNYYNPRPEDEIARRMANTDRKLERLVRQPPTAPTAVTDELADHDTELVALDGHTHAMDHHHEITTGVVACYFSAGALVQVGGSPPGVWDTVIYAFSSASPEITGEAVKSGSPRTDTDPWDAP